MAKTAHQIWVDFNNAKKQADRLDEIATKIENTSQKDFMANMNQLATCWVSDTSQAYRKKGQTVANNLNSVAKSLRKSASTIRQIAENTYNAELFALHTAEARTYK